MTNELRLIVLHAPEDKKAAESFSINSKITFRGRFELVGFDSMTAPLIENPNVHQPRLIVALVSPTFLLNLLDSSELQANLARITAPTYSGGIFVAFGNVDPKDFPVKGYTVYNWGENVLKGDRDEQSFKLAKYLEKQEQASLKTLNPAFSPRDHQLGGFTLFADTVRADGEYGYKGEVVSRMMAQFGSVENAHSFIQAEYTALVGDSEYQTALRTTDLRSMMIRLLRHLNTMDYWSGFAGRMGWRVVEGPKYSQTDI